MRRIRIKTGTPRLSFCPALAFPRPGFSLCSTRYPAFIGPGFQVLPACFALSELSGVFKRCGRGFCPSRIVSPSFDFCQTDQTLSGFSRLSGSTGAFPPPLCRDGLFSAGCAALLAVALFLGLFHHLVHLALPFGGAARFGILTVFLDLACSLASLIKYLRMTQNLTDADQGGERIIVRQTGSCEFDHRSIITGMRYIRNFMLGIRAVAAGPCPRSSWC